MFFKKLFKKTLLLLTIFIIPLNAYAYSDYLIAGGENVGIKLNSKGIMIVGTYSIDNTYPAREAGLKTGDIITSIDDDSIKTVYDLANKLSNVSSDTIKIGYVRNDISNYTNLKLYKAGSEYKTGMYIKDSITGIGTLTFIDPESKIFGALGHEIIEKNTKEILDSDNGSIYSSTVTSIKSSTNDNPGEKNAKLNINNTLGKIYENTNHGVFGQYTDEIPQKKLYKVAEYKDIKLGQATILTVLEDKNIGEYDINITRINNTNDNTKNIQFEITDKELLQKAGGIVQGMSGSPIVQDEYIIGAVTHVIVESPTRGYGIFIINMLEEAEN